MNDNKALVETRTGEIIPFDRGPIAIDEAKRRIKQNQYNAIEILEEGIDWVKIAGIPKPVLTKAAAEKLSRYAGVVGLPPVQAHYEILERDVDPFLEWEFEKKTYENGKFTGFKSIKTRGFYRYRVRCVLSVIGTEIIVGDKVGTCSSSDPGKETAMENTVLQQAQIRSNRQAVMAYVGISDRFTEEEAGDEVKRRKEVDSEGKTGKLENDSGFRMPFGKHKGELIAEVPTGYLKWCLDNMENLHDETRRTIETEIERQKEAKNSPPSEDNGKSESEPDPKPDDKTRPESADLPNSATDEQDTKSNNDRNGLVSEIQALENKLLEIDKVFKPLEFRRSFTGTTDLRKAALHGMKSLEALKANLGKAIKAPLVRNGPE